jgi:hypothetical protein
MKVRGATVRLKKYGTDVTEANFTDVTVDLSHSFAFFLELP